MSDAKRKNSNEHSGDNEGHGSDKSVSIIVNGRQKTVTGKEITFEEVVALAENLPTGPNILYTVTYRKSDGHKVEGTLVAGESVKVKDGTTFGVTSTDKS